MVLCDYCDACYHEGCAPSAVGMGPWYCAQCWVKLASMGPVDPILDMQLLDYLFKHRKPRHPDALARVKAAAKVYRASGHEL